MTGHFFFCIWFCLQLFFYYDFSTCIQCWLYDLYFNLLLIETVLCFHNYLPYLLMLAIHIQFVFYLFIKIFPV